jgi:hypothetical protein
MTGHQPSTARSASWVFIVESPISKGVLEEVQDAGPAAATHQAEGRDRWPGSSTTQLAASLEDADQHVDPDMARQPPAVGDR